MDHCDDFNSFGIKLERSIITDELEEDAAECSSVNTNSETNSSTPVRNCTASNEIILLPVMDNYFNSKMNITVKEEIEDHTEPSTSYFNQDNFTWETEMVICDNLNSLEIKLEQKESMLPGEPEEVSEEHISSFVITKSETSPLKLCIIGLIADTKIKVDTSVCDEIQDLHNICTCYVKLCKLTEHVVNSKPINCLNSKPDIKVVGVEDYMTQESFTSTSDQEILCKCNICGRCVDECSVRKHMLHHTNAKHKCNECGKCFNLIRDLKVHERIHTGEKPFKCTKCQKCFTQISSLKRHFSTHDGNKPFKCQHCDKNFTQNSSLKTHISLFHDVKKLFKCQQCDQSFVLSGHLKLHMLIHEGKNPFKCQLCDKIFTQVGNLKQHMLIHDGKKPFKCTHCDKSFTQNGHLKTHMLFHDGKKPFKCQQCSKCFTLSGGLKAHMLFHKGTKAVKCEQCDKSFTALGSLKKHMMVHDDKKP